jgi:hypothetical protein
MINVKHSIDIIWLISKYFGLSWVVWFVIWIEIFEGMIIYYHWVVINMMLKCFKYINDVV